MGQVGGRLQPACETRSTLAAAAQEGEGERCRMNQQMDARTPSHSVFQTHFKLLLFLFTSAMQAPQAGGPFGHSAEPARPQGCRATSERGITKQQCGLSAVSSDLSQPHTSSPHSPKLPRGHPTSVPFSAAQPETTCNYTSTCWSFSLLAIFSSSPAFPEVLEGLGGLGRAKQDPPP